MTCLIFFVSVNYLRKSESNISSDVMTYDKVNIQNKTRTTVL